jgi:hypothetical protein
LPSFPIYPRHTNPYPRYPIAPGSLRAALYGNGNARQESSKAVPEVVVRTTPSGAAFAHKKGNGFTLLIAGKRYAAFPPKAKAAVQPEATEGKGA